MDNQGKPMSKEHFRYLKGLAILAVMVGHIGNASGKTWFTPLGGIGVAIFLFCSGYGVMASYHQKGLKDFWKNKFINIWIPFAIVELITAIWKSNSVIDFACEIMFLKILSPYGWYMQYLAACYLIFYVGMRWIVNQKIRFTIWGILAALTSVFLRNLYGEQALSFISGLTLAELMYQKKLPLPRGKAKILAGGGKNVCSFMDVLRFKAKAMHRRRTPASIYFLEHILQRWNSSEHHCLNMCKETLQATRDVGWENLL